MSIVPEGKRAVARVGRRRLLLDSEAVGVADPMDRARAVDGDDDVMVFNQGTPDVMSQIRDGRCDTAYIPALWP